MKTSTLIKYGILLYKVYIKNGGSVYRATKVKRVRVFRLGVKLLET